MAATIQGQDCIVDGENSQDGDRDPILYQPTQ